MDYLEIVKAQQGSLGQTIIFVSVDSFNYVYIWMYVRSKNSSTSLLSFTARHYAKFFVFKESEAAVSRDG